MKNKLFPILFALPVTAGICGASLRATQMRHMSEASAGASLQSGLLIVCAIALLMALIVAFITKGEVSISGRFTSRLLPIASFIGAGLILLNSALLLFSLTEEFSATKLILAFFSVYSSVSFIVLGKYALAERENTVYCTFSAVPSFWMCFMLILTFRDKVPNPVISDYIFLVLSYISILFFTYAVAAHILGKKRKHIAVFSCFAGIFFILTELLSRLIAGSSITAQDFAELLPLIAFLPIMPFYTAEIIRKKD